MQSLMPALCKLPTTWHWEVINGIPSSHICKRFKTQRNRSTETFKSHQNVQSVARIQYREYTVPTKMHILSIFLLSHLLLADNQMISLQVNPNRQLSNQNRLFVCAQTIRTPIHRPFLETLSVTRQILEFNSVGRSQNHLRS